MAINIITPDHGSLTVTEAEGVANITAVPDTGYSLTSVQAICNGTLLDIVDMSFIIPEDGDVDVSAVFEADVTPVVNEKQHFIDAQYSNGEVRFEINGVTGVAAYAGDVVDIIASPFVGYELSSITGADIQNMQFTMPDSNVNLVISFVQTDFTITCAEFVQADAETGHAGDIITAIPTGLDDGEVFLGFIVECTELGICAWALDVVIEFEMPPYNVTVRQMTEEEAAEYAKITDEDGETGAGDVQPMDNSDVDGDSEVEPDDIDVVIPDPPSVTPEPPQDVENPPDGEVPTDPGQDGENPYSPPATIIVTRYTDEIISDFSQESLDFYENSGAIAIAVYDDDTEVEVPWSSVTDPSLPTINLVNEALVVAEATNQHFWHRITAPEGDTAGTGAFVTDEPQDDFLAAITAGTEPTTARPLHNLLMNSKGILLRAAKRIRAAFLPSGVAFYDGQGNEESNIVAKFGSGGSQMGKTGKGHVNIDDSGMSISDAVGKLLDIRARTDDDNKTWSTIRFNNLTLAEYSDSSSSQARLSLDSPQTRNGSGDSLVLSASGMVRDEIYGSDILCESDIHIHPNDVSIKSDGNITLNSDSELGSLIVGFTKDDTIFHFNKNRFSGTGDTAMGFAFNLAESRLQINKISVYFGNSETPVQFTSPISGPTADFATRVSSGGEVVIGGGVAGNQYYLSGKTPGRTGRVLFIGGGKKADGDSAGTVVGLGAGGLTIVGGGEYANNRYNVGDLNDTAEYLYLGSDNDVYIETNGNTIANRKTFRFSTGGVFWVPKGGAIEAGQFFDFHTPNEPDNTDFMARINAAETGSITLFPTDGGYASSTNNPRAQWTFQQDMKLAVRRFDGSAWGSWSYYQFGNEGRIEASGPFTMNTSLALGTAANAHPIEARDSSGVIIAQNRVGVTTDKRSYNYLVARQGTSSSGGIKQVSFGIQCDSSGTATYHVQNPENFRSEIGLGSLATKSSLAKSDIPTLDYLPLSGGTLTGSIELASGKVLFAKNTTHDVAASSLSAQTDQNVAVCLDKNSNATVGVLSRQLTTGEMRGIFQARHNNASGTAVWNALQLGVKPDGTRTVVLSDKGPWLDALGLGSTTTATSGVVTAASGWTVVLQSLASWGRMRILHLRVKNASATSGTRKVATLAAAHKPKGPDAAIATMYSPTTGSGYITTSGDIYIGGSLAADTEWNGMFIWLV